MCLALISSSSDDNVFGNRTTVYYVNMLHIS